MNRGLALLLAGLVLCAPACGAGNGDDDGPSAADVEQSLRADLVAGGERVVDLGTSPPKLVTCEKDPHTEAGWRCTVTAASGRNIVCFVQAEAESGRTVRRVCAPVDN